MKDQVESELPTPGAADDETQGTALTVAPPTGFDGKEWDRHIRKMRATTERMNDKHYKLNSEVLPLIMAFGLEAEQLVGKKDEGTQRSAIAALSKALNMPRTRIQSMQAFARLFGSAEMCSLVAPELGLDTATDKDVCNYLAKQQLSFSVIAELFSIRSAKKVLELIKEAVADGMSVRDLRKRVSELTSKTPALLTDAAQRRDLQRKATLEKRKSEGKTKDKGPKANGPVQTCDVLIARVEAYEEASGDLFIQLDGAETVDGPEGKKLKDKLDELTEKLQNAQATLKANLDAVKKTLKKIKS